MFKVKRVYELADPADGRRILVDRLWPRGINRERAGIDAWMKDVAPSDVLRREFHGNPDAWEVFRAAYAAELEREPAAGAAAQLLEWGRAGPVTLLYAAKDETRNNAEALRLWLEGR